MPLRKRICVVTGTRAEYGLLKHLMQGIKSTPELHLQVLVTGAHLSENHGNTHIEIIEDGFCIDFQADIDLSDDSPIGISRSTGLGVAKIAAGIEQLNPDLLVLLGDRYEILSAAIAALVAGVPIAHIHGGEITEGAIDESIRHAITKLSHLHFVAHETYRRRVIQLGEDPGRVFNVGGLGVDSILSTDLMTRSELELSLKIQLSEKNLLVTFHPVTLEPGSAVRQVQELLKSLDKLTDTKLIFTMPNADTGRDMIYRKIRDFCANHPNSVFFDSLGSLRYLSCLQFVDGVIGNSSSGLLEAPTFQKGTINIGNRQKGRVLADSVIQCEASEQSIDAAIDHLMSPQFQSDLAQVTNPYGKGGASKAILRIIGSTDLNRLSTKAFYDLPNEDL